ncbi:type VII toxin-antitoxin system HepT family RNase toxin [Archaeoglobus sp.]
MKENEIIEGKIDVIQRNLDFLEEYKHIDEDTFLNSYKDVQAVKYSLLEIIEACLDIASHIISARGFERAESYAEMFDILGRRGIISKELAEDMARFRNILVHGYAKVDNARVLEIVKTELSDVVEFVRQILRKL